MNDEGEAYDAARGLRLIGKSYMFEDGNKIEVVQLKRRDDGPWVTYHTTQSGAIPRKLLLPLNDFLAHYGHLFE